MNIFFPINLKPTGGSSSFAKKFQSEAAKQGHQVSFTPLTKYDVLLVSTSCPIKYLFQAKLQNIPIIHRLDGIYYPSTISGYKFPFYNTMPLLIRRFLANTLIYQSHYSKQLCDMFLGPTRQPHHLIYNGIDVNHFTPYGDKQPLKLSHRQHTFITASRFRRRDQIIPLILAFKHYREHFHPNSHLYILGNFEDKISHLPKRLKNQPHLTFTGPIPNQKLPDYLRSADVFLFTHQNPPCPNNVIEAMACGLPICGVNDGAMKEITRPGLNSELIPAHGSGYIKARHLNIAAFAVNLNKIISRLPHYSHYSRQMALTKFKIDYMVKQYLNVINNLL